MSAGMNAPVQAPRRQAGVTLIEVLVTMLLGLILLGGVVSLFVSSNRGYQLQGGMLALTDTARFALGEIERDLRQAVHWGGASEGALFLSTPSITSDCTNLGRAGTTAVDSLVVTEVGSPAPTNWGCVTAASLAPNNHAILIRSAAAVRQATRLSGRYYVRARTGGPARIFLGSVDDCSTTNIGAALDLVCDTARLDIARYFYRQALYYLDPDDNLQRSALTGQAMTTALVSVGVERMRVMYQVDVNGDRSTLRYMSPAQATTALGTNLEERILGVHTQLLIRAPELELGLDALEEADHTYTFVDSTTHVVPAADRNYRRHLFSSLVQLRNNFN